MARKERIASLMLGIFLFCIAAFFSLGLIVQVLDFTGNESFLKSVGGLLSNAYGLCSILVPAFFFVAASFCLSARWSLSRALVLMISVIPFFTMVAAEKQSRHIAATDPSAVAIAKIISLIVIAILFVALEYAVTLVIAGKIEQNKITGRKFTLSALKRPAKNIRTLFVSRFPQKTTVPVSNKDAEEKHPETSKDETVIIEEKDEPVEPVEQIQPVKETKNYDDVWTTDKDGTILTEPVEEDNESESEKSNAEEILAPILKETVPQEEEGDDIIDAFESGAINLSDDWQNEKKNSNPIEYDMDFEQAEEDPDDELENSFRQYEESLSLDDRDDTEVIDGYDIDEVSDEEVIDPFEMDETDSDYENTPEEEPDQEPTSSSAPYYTPDPSNLTQNRSANMSSALGNVFSRMEEDARMEVSAHQPPAEPSVEPEPVYESHPAAEAQVSYNDQNQNENTEKSEPENSYIIEENSTVSENTPEEIPSEPQICGVTAMVTKNGETAPLQITPKKNNSFKGYSISTDLLIAYDENPYWIIDDETKAAALNLKATLNEFRIEAEITNIVKGPVVTMFEMLPAPGIKLSKIVGLADNIALSLSASSVRIVAPIPGKRAVGIEIPNKKRAIVSFRECIEQQRPEWKKMAVPVVLGKDIQGESQIMDLVKTPHLLIAGATGAGKSVCVNSMILSILYKRSPSEVKMILIDPKVVELKLYNGIPHLLTPVITEPKKAMQALQYALCEMERRYAVLDGMGCRDISSYNRKIVEQHIATEKLPYMVIIMDEFADLMATTGKQLESVVARLCAMSRAVGIHLVLATQRPSVDVITGLIKANIPSRVAFMVAAKTDSRIIIDQVGAEKLLGKGDMLYASAADPFPVRIQGTFVSDQEVEDVVNAVKAWGEPEYIDEEIFIEDEDEDTEGQISLLGESGDDPLYDKALDIVVQAGKASASYIQRRLSIGYNRAARLVELMEERGIVGPANGSKPREIIRMP